MFNDLYCSLREQAIAGRLFAEIKERAVSYASLLKSVRQTVGLFRALKLQPKQRIVVMAQDDFSLISLVLAAFFEGVCPILLPSDTKMAKFKRLLTLTEPQYIWMDEAQAEQFRPECTCPIMAIEGIQKNQAFIHKLLGKNKSSPIAYPGVLANYSESEPSCDADPDALALIVFTSGSTAEPKGVMLSVRNIMTHLQTFQKVFAYDRQSVLFNNLPLYHMDGLIQGPLITLYAGACLIRPEKFALHNLDRLLNKVPARKVSHIVLVPSILALLDRYALHDDYFSTPAAPVIISTASYLSADLWARLQRRFKVQICNVYGLIETVTGGLFCGPGTARFAIGTVGAPVDMQAKIVDERGVEQNQGDVGELILKGDNICSGYWGNPQQSGVLLKDGWLYTGDFARQNAHGLYEIVGRKKEVIVNDGVSVYPEEINEVLRLHPQVQDVVTFGFNDSLGGEGIAVALEVIASVTETEIIEFCHHYLESEKMPKWVFFISEMPRGPAGKPLLPVVKARAEAYFAGKEKADTGLSEAVLVQIAAQVFHLPTEQLSIHSTPLTIAAWDSLGHIRLVEAVEQHFQIRFGLQEIISIASLSDLYRYTVQGLRNAV